MGGYIQKVADTLERAERNGTAKNAPYEANHFNGTFKLYHYGTLIFEGSRNGVVQLGGWSKSDSDAISTALHFLSLGKIVSRAKSRQKEGVEMNGWRLI